MRQGTLRATVAAGALSLAALGGVLLTRPSVVGLFRSFAAPVPARAAPSSSSSLAALPADTSLAGGESRELRRLAATADAGPLPSGREALFPPVLPATPKTPERVEALHRPSIVHRDDARTEAALAYLARDPRGHPALLSAYARSGRYRATVDRVLRAWNVPEDLLAVAAVESAFVPTATQPDGSAGMWSLSREVAEAYGLTLRDTFDERRAVETSTEVAGRYLADLKERLGSWPLAILAFRWGYKHTQDELSKHRSPVFEDLVEELPTAEAGYVFQVFAVASVFANPERFGLDASHLDPPLATSDLEVPAQAPFSLIARAAGTSVEHLHELNPEYLGETVPTTGAAMTVHLPTDGLARAKELLTPLLYAPNGTLNVPAVADDRAPHPPRSKGTGDPGGSEIVRGNGERIYYRVREGETLAAIAARFGVAIETVASDNALDVTSTLPAGRLLSLRVAASAPPSRK